MNNPQVRVGIGIMVFKDGKILLGKRKSFLGQGEYAGLGGHLEFGESIEQCAKREAREEAGIELKNIDIGLKAEWAKGKPKVLEPEKCEGFEWYDLDNLPSPLFAAEHNYLEALKSNKNFFDE